MNLDPAKLRRLRKPYERARLYQHYRESVGSAYTKAYGLFRVYFIEAGRRLVERGELSDVDDVFFLYYDELSDVLLAKGDLDPVATVARRREEFEYARTLIPPETVFGEDPEPIEPGSFAELKGTPTSRGQYRGRAVQVSGLGDAAKLIDGDVLFVPFTDVAWTPLFARAGAVVAESGGFLSHASIVARERGIPAVVSVSGATQVPDGAEVHVDGYSGIVTILDGDSRGRCSRRQPFVHRALIRPRKLTGVGSLDEHATLAVDALERPVEHEVVEGQHRVPVRPAEEPLGIEGGRLAHERVLAERVQLVLQPALAGQLHLGFEPQQARGIDLLDAPPLEVITLDERVLIAPSSSAARPAEQAGP